MVLSCFFDLKHYRISSFPGGYVIVYFQRLSRFQVLQGYSHPINRISGGECFRNSLPYSAPGTMHRFSTSPRQFCIFTFKHSSNRLPFEKEEFIVELWPGFFVDSLDGTLLIQHDYCHNHVINKLLKTDAFLGTHIPLWFWAYFGSHGVSFSSKKTVQKSITTFSFSCFSFYTIPSINNWKLNNAKPSPSAPLMKPWPVRMAGAGH